MAFPLINGSTQIVAHIGYPTHSFKAPMIYNPYFEQADIDAVVLPMGMQVGDPLLASCQGPRLPCAAWC